MAAVTGLKISQATLALELNSAALIELSQNVTPESGPDYLDTFKIDLTAFSAFLSSLEKPLICLGDWDASTNTPTIVADGLPRIGDFYRVAGAGTRFSKKWRVDDLIWWDGVALRKIDGQSLLDISNAWLGANDFTNAAASVLVKDPTLANHPVNKQYFEETVSKTSIADSSGNRVTFTRPTIWAASYNGSTGLPVGLTGNIYSDVTGAVRGIIQKIYHNDGSTPTFPTGWEKVAGEYATGQLNIIHCEFVAAGSTSSRIEYWISQA